MPLPTPTATRDARCGFTSETWRSVADPVHGEFYEVSDHGRVRSLGGPRRPAGRVLRPHAHKYGGYLYVSLYSHTVRRTAKVHRLVLEAFVGPCPNGMECLHGDGNTANNHISNLRWGTHLENHDDMRAHGTNHQVRKERCNYGHPLAEPNLVVYMARDGYRSCLACHRAHSRRLRLAAKGIAADQKSLADAYYAEIMEGVAA